MRRLALAMQVAVRPPRHRMSEESSASLEVHGSDAVKVAERRDLSEALTKSRKAARRHTFWAAMGVSPGAALPMFLSLNEAGLIGVVVASCGVACLEMWRALKANREADAIEAQLDQLDSVIPIATRRR